MSTRETINHTFSTAYTLINHGFLTNQSARRVLSILQHSLFALMSNFWQKFKLVIIFARVFDLKSCNRVLSWLVIKDDKREFKSQYVYNKHNTTWKVLCTVFTHSLFLYQKSHSFAALTRSIPDTSTTSAEIPYAPSFHEVFSLFSISRGR